jgi:hypothetical protein
MRKGTLLRHRTIGVAALLSLGGIVIAACAPATEETAAPVYMMGTVSPDEFGKVAPVMRHSVAAAASEPTVSDPTPLAPALTASASSGKAAVDVIPLDDPPAPAKPAAKSAFLAANPAPMSARFMPPPDVPASRSEPAGAPIAAAKAETSMASAATAPTTGPLAGAPSRSELSAAELARAEPAPAAPAAAVPVVQPAPALVLPAVVQPAALPVPPIPIAEPAHADIATAGLVISARDERASYRPRYHYAP